MTLRISTVFLESLNRMHASQPSWFKLLLFGTRIAHLLMSYVICIAGETKREFTIQMALRYIYIYKFYKILYIYLKCVFHWGLCAVRGGGAGDGRMSSLAVCSRCTPLCLWS